MLSLSGGISTTNDANVQSDVYVAVVMPDDSVWTLGSDAVWQPTLQPILSEFPLAKIDAPNFYSTQLPADVMAGKYTFYLVAAPAGTKDPGDASTWLGYAKIPVHVKETVNYQRYITFKNDFAFPIFPVIQVPADICDGAQNKGVRRILVNTKGEQGLASGDTVTVLIPNGTDDKKEVTVDVNGKPTTVVRNCWYQAGRIYIFAVDLSEFEKKMVALDSNNDDMITKYADPEHPKQATCFQGSMQKKGDPGFCKIGTAKNSFSADVPAQLAEYTFDSDGGSPNLDPDTGIPMADIDVSNVDDLAFPLAASVDNHGATGYMGLALDLTEFNTRVNRFTGLDKGMGAQLNWPIYAAYLKADPAYNAFAKLLPTQLNNTADASLFGHIPAAYNSINNTLGRPLSALYRVHDKPGQPNYLITGVQYDETTKIPANTEFSKYLDRWKSWIAADQPYTGPCANLGGLKWPDNITEAFDKLNFCEKFRENVQLVWEHFLEDKSDGFNGTQGVYKTKPSLNSQNWLAFYSDCGLYDEVNHPDVKPAKDDDRLKIPCIIQHIVGYNSQMLTGELPSRVQALLRGVAYDPEKTHRQYQFDPFLLFAAPYDSEFNLDPFTRFIHNTKDGVGAVAYSFSIDDKYGNFRDASSGFIVDAGGVSELQNQAAYDPYQQYKLSWGYNLYKISVARLAPGVDVVNSQAQLRQIAAQYENHPILMKLADDRLVMLGQDRQGAWKLTEVTTRLALEALAQREYTNSNGQSKTYQLLLDHLYDAKSSIFPETRLNPAAADGRAIAVLDWDVDTVWNAGKALLYDTIRTTGAHSDAVSNNNNWLSAKVCGVTVSIDGPGNHSMAMPFKDNAYQPCEIELTDKHGDTLAFKTALVQKQVVDTYTGASVNVMSLPVGDTVSGDQKITTSLSKEDLEYCKAHSDFNLISSCPGANVSANWSDDAYARDIVYMGLDHIDMPRVNFSVPPAPLASPDQETPYFPYAAKLEGELLGDGVTVHVTWPRAEVNSGKPLRYELTFDHLYQIVCEDPGTHINTRTYCDVKIAAGDETPKAMSVVAINYTTDTSPPPANAELKGTFTP